MFRDRHLAADVFNFGNAATESDDRIIYNRLSGALWYDSNGSLAGGDIFQLATLKPGLDLTSSDFVVI